MSVSFTDRELDVMAVLWEVGSATVRDVQERLEPDLAYTTVLTILRTLEAKGHVRHEPEGRAHRYFPVVARDEAGSTALRQLLSKVFSGSPEALMTQLVSDRSLTEEDLRRLRRLLDERLQE
jgi:predicted transcriptional regulator